MRSRQRTRWKRSGRDSKAARSKTHSPSESAQHGENKLAPHARDDENEPRRSRVFPADSCNNGGEIRCRATASPLPLRVVRHTFVPTIGERSGMAFARLHPPNDSVTTLSRHEREKLKMTLQKVTTILGAVLAFACVANPGFAQTQATTTNRTQTSGDQSSAAMAQEAANPFSSRWLMQMQQNNNWIDVP